MSPDQRFTIDFNLHWVPAALGLNIPPVAASAILGITEEQFAAYCAEARQEVRKIAAELLANGEYAGIVDRLPVPPGGAIMTIGDSITTYRYGYAEILRETIDLRRSKDAIRFLNVAQSGYTSNHGVENTYTQFLAKQPDLVLVKFGANDCKRFGHPEGKRLVSPEEYRRNIAAIADAFRLHTRARVVLLTPTPVLTRIVNTYPPFAPMRMTWTDEDFRECADAVLSVARDRGIPAIDLLTPFGKKPDESLVLPDGLHPSPKGHRIVIDRILRGLASLR
ncbi:MAG: hypothetical protein A2Z34_04530 [Planctomycetes bacterium RBG_16_59_8]|nr:MAG: hypothetical protein A2Z34_04530 [Planctomycetes bacterium RBG_16_59_8]